MSEPTIYPTAGGRGPDWEAISAAAQRPHEHTATVTTVSEYTQTGPRTALEAYESRRKRLREAGTPHQAHRHTLTIRYVDHACSTVTITYAPIEDTDQLPGQGELDLDADS